MCRPQDPLFQAIFSSRDPLSQALFQLERPHFVFFFFFFLIIIYSFIFNLFSFQFVTSSPIFANFGLILTPETQILAKICSGDPSFKGKKSVPETLLLKTWVAHTYPINFLVSLPWTPLSLHPLIQNSFHKEMQTHFLLANFTPNDWATNFIAISKWISSLTPLLTGVNCTRQAKISKFCLFFCCC